MTTTKKATFKTIPVGTKVTWHYRSAIGHGTVKGIHEKGSNKIKGTNKSIIPINQTDSSKTT